VRARKGEVLRTCAYVLGFLVRAVSGKTIPAMTSRDEK